MRIRIRTAAPLAVEGLATCPRSSMHKAERSSYRMQQNSSHAIVNSTGLVAVVSLPQCEVSVIMGGLVVLAAAIIAVATRSQLGLKPSLDALPKSTPGQVPRGLICRR
jgi:hypothetical protein